MPATKQASAQWRRKKLDEGAKEFRAKEALRIKNYRAQLKGKQVVARECSRKVVSDANESDDVDTWFNRVVEDHCSPRYSRGSSHRPISPTLSLISGSGGLCNGTNDNVPCPPELAGQTISFRDADDAVANARKILQDWNNRWGSFPFVSSRGAEALRGSEGVKMPLTRAYYELRSMRRIGRVGLLRLRSIACIDTQSIPVDRLPDFWREVYYIMECLLELILRAELLLEICFEVDSST